MYIISCLALNYHYIKLLLIVVNTYYQGIGPCSNENLLVIIKIKIK